MLHFWCMNHTYLYENVRYLTMLILLWSNVWSAPVIEHGRVYQSLQENLIWRFTVTSHAELRGRLRRLFGRREKLAAIYVVFTIYSSANKQLWWCRVLLWCILVDVWIVCCHFTAFPRKRNDDNFSWMRSSANIGLRLRPTSTELWTVLIISIKSY